MSNRGYHDQPSWMAEPSWRLAFRPYTAWRAGSRRAFADAIDSIWSIIERRRQLLPDEPLERGADHREQPGWPALGWFVREATRAGYITELEAGDILGPSASTARQATKVIWDFDTDPAYDARRRQLASGDRIGEQIRTAARHAARGGPDAPDWFRTWREILALPLVPDPAASAGPAGPDLALDWPPGTSDAEIGSDQWRLVEGDWAHMAAVVEGTPVWVVGNDTTGGFLAGGLRRATAIEVVGPLEPGDVRLRVIPPEPLLVVRNSLAGQDDARTWLDARFDRDPTLARRTVLTTAYDCEHFGSWFSDTGAWLVTVGGTDLVGDHLSVLCRAVQGRRGADGPTAPGRRRPDDGAGRGVDGAG